MFIHTNTEDRATILTYRAKITTQLKKKKKKKVRTTGNGSFTTSCSGILKSFQNICFCVPKRKMSLMAGEGLMGNIKVTFLAERVKAEERFCDKRI